MNHFESNYQFNNSLSNYYYSTPFDTSSFDQTIEMDNSWCHQVPNSMPDAFNIEQDQLNSSAPHSLFRFTANPPPNSSDGKFSKSSSISSNNNWKTINDLSTASSSIKPFKRKGLLDDEDDFNEFKRPIKQNATEERVIGKLNKLRIDEEFDEFDSDEFLTALDEDFKENSKDGSDLGDNVDKEIEFELSDNVQDYWNRNNDVITKIVNDQRDKDSKALVLYRPRISILTNEKNEEDFTDKYTVIEEEDDLKKDDKNSLEIIEIDDEASQSSAVLIDEDMMEI